MTLTQIIGQRFGVGFEGKTVPEDFRAFVRRTQIGSVILFSRNIGTAQETRALCEEIQRIVIEETGRPALIMADQEGGAVKRLGKDAALVPSAMALAAAGGGDIRTAMRITGDELAAVGINMDLAPVADVNSNPLNPIIGPRSYGDTPEKVGACVAEAVRGLHDAGVYSCAKHFPGHGDTALDSHLDLPMVDRSLKELEAQELVPFQAAAMAGTDAVMTTHILFPQLETENIPATMSRTILQGLLREKLGFQGLIISDCMMMSAIRKFYGTVEGSLAAVKAGVDIVLICHDMALMEEAWQKVYDEAIAGRISMEELQNSADRVLRYREQAVLFAGDVSQVGRRERLDAAQDMMDRAVTHLGAPVPALSGKCLFTAPAPSFAGKVNDSLDQFTFADFLSRRFRGTGFTFAMDPEDQEIESILSQAKDADVICLGTVSALRHPGQDKLLRALAGLGKPMIAAALRDPYELKDLPEHVCALALYEYDRMSMKALERVLSGEIKPTGTLPVKL